MTSRPRPRCSGARCRRCAITSRVACATYAPNSETVRMPNHDQRDHQLFASLRRYGVALDRDAEQASPSNAPVADLVPLPPAHPRRYLLAAAVVAVVVAAGAGVVLARDTDPHPKIRTPSNTVPSATVTT